MKQKENIQRKISKLRMSKTLPCKSALEKVYFARKGCGFTKNCLQILFVKKRKRGVNIGKFVLSKLN